MHHSVAPLVGAWIEIHEMASLILNVRVAPLVGAWIEIDMALISWRHSVVAPLVGAWIEMSSLNAVKMSRTGRSPCGSVD